MSEDPRGKRGTVKMDPTATIPEPRPPLRFVDGDALGEADKADLAAPSSKPAKPPTPSSDRQEFARAKVDVPARGKTLELQKVDVTKADPRKFKTVKGKGITFTPGLHEIEDPEPVERKGSTRVAKVVALVCVAGLVVVMGLLAWSRWFRG
jgi:hypothetical protein